MDTSKAQAGMPLAALVLTAILLPAWPLPSHAQHAPDGRYDSDTEVYGGHSRHNTGARPWKKKSDAELRETVKNGLASSPLVAADDVEVSVRNGNVTLKGTVENQRSLEDAIEHARDAGAKIVISKLKTQDEDAPTAYGGSSRHNTGIRPWKKKSDAELREYVKNELATSPLIDADDIEVSVRNGNVTLKGTVKNERSLEDAIDNARDAGAKTVISRLKTQDEDTTAYAGHSRHNTGARPWKKKSDAELKETVKNGLASSPLVDADDIEVSVKNGNVTLKGTVENERSLEDAIDNARDAGAKTVISKLKMQEEE
jgi:osmotically-inducible protein OsmY